jgi:hypothetical protein
VSTRPRRRPRLASATTSADGPRATERFLVTSRGGHRPDDRDPDGLGSARRERPAHAEADVAEARAADLLEPRRRAALEDERHDDGRLEARGQAEADAQVERAERLEHAAEPLAVLARHLDRMGRPREHRRPLDLERAQRLDAVDRQRAAAHRAEAEHLCRQAVGERGDGRRDSAQHRQAEEAEPRVHELGSWQAPRQR